MKLFFSSFRGEQISVPFEYKYNKSLEDSLPPPNNCLTDIKDEVGMKYIISKW